VGTAGLAEGDFAEIDVVARGQHRGVLACGNFALTVVLLQQFAETAARLIPPWEIIDYAHDDKVDAPSGTARELAARLTNVRHPEPSIPVDQNVGAREARGATLAGSQVHSLRLPGFVISAEIIFGMPDQRLTIRHDSGGSARPYVDGAQRGVAAWRRQPDPRGPGRRPLGRQAHFAHVDALAHPGTGRSARLASECRSMRNSPLRSLMRASLAEVPGEARPGIRPPLPADQPALGQLMHRAYLGTVDYDGETVAQSLEEIRKTFSGEYGAFNAACSRVLDDQGRLLCATLITVWEDRPFVAFSMTSPDVRNQGLARACMTSAMIALRDCGEHELRLVVTRANLPAVALYRRLGFEEESP
jgi:ribosomal protein S18 acetylase RimI-like enzyme